VASPKKDVALLQIAVSVTIGSSAVCLQWSTGRALAAGATNDEITDVPLAIALMARLGRSSLPPRWRPHVSVPSRPCRRKAPSVARYQVGTVLVIS